MLILEVVYKVDMLHQEVTPSSAKLCQGVDDNETIFQAIEHICPHAVTNMHRSFSKREAPTKSCALIGSLWTR
jgi:hypothetical protein